MVSLTRQIIKDVVSEEIKNEIKGVNQKIDKLDKKMDVVITQLTDIAGQFRKFDEEQIVLSGQMSDRTDRIEQLEITVFGTAVA